MEKKEKMMEIKNSNEITVKIECEIEELYNILKEKGFKVVDRFSMDDTYYVPEYLNLEEMNVRDILGKAVLAREIFGKISGKVNRLITVKSKVFDEEGNILSQKAVNCKVFEIDDAKNLLNAMRYKEIMNIKENDVVYEKDAFQLAIKDIVNGDNLIEIETDENSEFNSIEKLIQKLKEIDIPVYLDNFFVKKAEVELNKVFKK